MSRYSPTVLEQPFDLGGVIDQMMEGYYGGRQRKQEARSRRRQEEIEERQENRYMAALKAEALARPGAMTLGEGLDRYPLTGSTLARVGNAAEQNVPLEFERPEPQSLADFIPGAEGKAGEYMFQDRAPYMIGPDVVMDPGRARQERMQESMLGHHLKQYLEGPQPWEPTTREEQIEFGRDTAAAQRAPEQPKPWEPMTRDEQLDFKRDTTAIGAGGPEPPKSLKLLDRQIADADFALSRLWSFKPSTPTKDSDSVVRGAFNAWQRQWDLEEARSDSLNTLRDRISRDYMIEEGVVPPERPAPQDTRSPYRRGAGPLREFENPPESDSLGLFPRLRRALPPDRVPAPSAAGGGAPSDLVGRARALRREHPDWTREQVIAELRRQDEAAAPSVSPDLTLAQRQDMAAKEWEELVDAGTDPDEATRLLREKYGLPGGQ